MTLMCECISRSEINPWPGIFVELRFGMARAAIHGAHIINGGASIALMAFISSLAGAGLNSKMTFRSCVFAIADFLSWLFCIAHSRTFLSTGCRCDVGRFARLFPGGNGHCCCN